MRKLLIIVLIVMIAAAALTGCNRIRANGVSFKIEELSNGVTLYHFDEGTIAVNSGIAQTFDENGDSYFKCYVVNNSEIKEDLTWILKEAYGID